MNRSAKHPQYIARQQRALDRWQLRIATGRDVLGVSLKPEQIDYAKQQAAKLVAKLGAAGVQP